MSAYSRQDIEEAFECAAEDAVTVPPSLSPGLCREKVFNHLDGHCDCDRNRCPECRRRPHNKLLDHEQGCPRALAKV